MNTAGYAQNAVAPMPIGLDAEKGHAPATQTLVQILQERRSGLLTELRDLEQTIEHLEANPTFEGTFQRVSKILSRGRY